MRVLITCVVLALLASCDSKESCEERGGIWGASCHPAGCDDLHCLERTEDAGKTCKDYEDCMWACEAPGEGGFGGAGCFDNRPGPVVGRCCDHEECRPKYIVMWGCVTRPPVE